MAHAEAFASLIDDLAALVAGRGFTKVAAIDIRSGEGSSMAGDATAALIFLASFWLAGKYFTLNSIVLLITALFLAIACSVLLFVLPKMQKFGIAEAAEVAGEIRRGILS